MKRNLKLLIGTILCLFVTPLAFAEYLTCDPQPAEIVTKYQINLNGETLPAELDTVGENQVRIYYNIDHLGDGKFIVSAQAGNDKGEWSTPSDVLEFYRGVPTPQNIGLYCVSGDPGRLPQEELTISFVSSEETEQEIHLAKMVLDGNVETQWHTTWGDLLPPHEIHIDLGRTRTVQGLYYLPRQDSSWNGAIKNYRLYISTDETNWVEVASGSFAESKDEQLVEFTPILARFVSLVCLSAVNDGRWASAAEINILGY